VGNSTPPRAFAAAGIIVSSHAVQRLADQRRPKAVRCIGLMLIEAPSCAYPTRGRLDAATTNTRIRAGGNPMRFYTGQHRHWCGIDLHARTM
jgi:hypothetical protein